LLVYSLHKMRHRQFLLDKWGPPMEKLVYLILSRDKDKFNIIYVGNCEKTDDKSFFVQHSHFKCWIQQSGSEKSLYLAILPMFESSNDHRQNVFHEIMTHYKPPCNSTDVPEPKPDYVVRKNRKTEFRTRNILLSLLWF